MSGYRRRMNAKVRPLTGAPFHGVAELNFRDKKELAEQLTTYARHKWPTARAITLDQCKPAAGYIVIDGRVTAEYSLHEPAATQDKTGTLL